MHDSRIEDQLRAGLRAEADRIPLTIGTAELERRLLARRHATGGRRIALLAAGVAAIAIGSIVAVGNGWLGFPSVATTPSPSPTASARPSVEPSAVPSSTPIAGIGRSPLGRPDQAILVRPIGASWTMPDSLEVTRFDLVDFSSEPIATIPGSVVPRGKWISTGAKPVVSRTGWLAIPVSPGPDATDREAAIVVVDLLHPTAKPQTLVGVSSGAWNGDDMLAAIGVDGVRLFDPATGSVVAAPILDPAVRVTTLGGDANDPIWVTAPDDRFVATRDTGATMPYGSQQWGAISVDGSFSATTDLPPTYQRTGLERPAGADAHGLERACQGNGNVVEAGCSLIETDSTTMPIATRVITSDIAFLSDYVWAANGHDAWLLFSGGTQAGGGGGLASLALSGPTGSREERGRIDYPAGSEPRILGVGADTPTGGSGSVVLGDRDGFVRGFIAFDGGSDATEDLRTSWFAGWAGDHPDYDPD